MTGKRQATISIFHLYDSFRDNFEPEMNYTINHTLEISFPAKNKKILLI